MNVGNELYTAVSNLSRETYLMLRELPSEVIAFNTTFQIQYSPSHISNVHGSCTIMAFAYCVSLISTFQNLITENYNSFILFLSAWAGVIQKNPAIWLVPGAGIIFLSGTLTAGGILGCVSLRDDLKFPFSLTPTLFTYGSYFLLD